MIETDAQLQQAMEQVERLHEGLQSLRRDILPVNRRNFAIMGEGPLDEIHKLQSEIEQYVLSMEEGVVA